jgi:hypothetical protein
MEVHKYSHHSLVPAISFIDPRPVTLRPVLIQERIANARPAAQSGRRPEAVGCDLLVSQ